MDIDSLPRLINCHCNFARLLNIYMSCMEKADHILPLFLVQVLSSMALGLFN